MMDETPLRRGLVQTAAGIMRAGYWRSAGTGSAGRTGAWAAAGVRCCG